MTIDTPTNLIADIKARFKGKLAGATHTSATVSIKDAILEKGTGSLDHLGSSESHWKLKTTTGATSNDTNGYDDWEDYLSKKPDGSVNGLANATEQGEFEHRRGSVLLCLARCVIEAIREEQDSETDAGEKTNWLNTLKTYMSENQVGDEMTTYNDGKGTTTPIWGTRYYNYINDIITRGGGTATTGDWTATTIATFVAGTTPITPTPTPIPVTPPHGLTLPLQYTTVVSSMFGHEAGARQRAYDAMPKDKTPTETDDKSRERDPRQQGN